MVPTGLTWAKTCMPGHKASFMDTRDFSSIGGMKMVQVSQAMALGFSRQLTTASTPSTMLLKKWG